MGRIEPLEEFPTARTGPGKLFSGKYRKQAIVKLLSKMGHANYSQWTLLMVDSKGRATVDASDAFDSYKDMWFPEHLIKQATAITVTVAAKMREQKRHEAEYAGGQLKEEAEDEAVIEEMDDFDNDAEHEDDGGINNSKTSTNGIENPLQGSPQPSGYSFSPTTPTARKRSLTTVKTTPLQKRRRRSSAVKGPLPVQRSDSSSGDSNAVTTAQGITYRPLLISDEQAVTTFFETRFRQMQQLTCKVVAKAWIKVIEPKKQSNFPYNRGEESKPSWWPAGARHKEPDHLMKPERLLLLMTMLRCRRVPVAKLEMATSEVSAHIEECRIGLLEEIYRVAKMEERWIAGTLPADSCCYVAASADKIVSNQKPPSPKVIGNTVTSPSGSIAGQNSESCASANPGSRNNGLGVSTRPTPATGQTGTAVQSNSSNPFSTQAVQGNLQPLQAPISFNASSYMPSTQVHEEPYIQPIHSYQYGRLGLYGSQNSAPPALRRTQTMSSISQQPFSPWPQVPTLHVGGQLFSPYGPNTQTHPVSHGYPSHPHHAGSQPPTPVSAPPAPYQTMQLPPPPLPPIHQHHPHTSLVSFSEFLESPIPDRAYDLGSVTEGGVGVVDGVGIGVTRSENSTGTHSLAK